MAVKQREWKNVPKRGLWVLMGIMLMAFWGLATEAGVTRQKFLAGGPLQTGAAWAAAGQAGGSPPAPLQAKIERMHALAHQRQQEGVDMRPIVEIAHGIQPLLEQQKFSEAEALVDRVLKLLGDSPTPEASAPAQQPAATPAGVPPSLQAKMARLQALAEKREAEGFDMTPVGPVADGIQPLIDQQKFAEAEAQVDRALKLLGETTPQEQPRPQSQTGPPQSLQQKVHRLQALIERREQEGADLQPVGELMQGMDPLMQQQKYTEAEALVDRALKLLGDSPTPEASAPAQQPAATPGGVPPSLQAKMARLQALAEKREAEGFDMTPVGPVADGIQPLMEQHKYTEAEALVDRVLKLLGDSPTP